MHPLEMLGEEILAIGFVAATSLLLRMRSLLRRRKVVVVARARSRLRRARGPDIAAVDAKGEMDRRDVTLPFVLGAERGFAAVTSKRADKRPGVGREHMFGKGRGRREGLGALRVGAGDGVDRVSDLRRRERTSQDAAL